MDRLRQALDLYDDAELSWKNTLYEPIIAAARLVVELNHPAVASSWQTIDAALDRLVVNLTADEVSAWSVLRHVHERLLTERPE